MTSIEILKNLDNRIVGFNMSEHADFDVRGQDIVCAALSVLSQNTYFSLLKLTGLLDSEIVLKSDEEKGIYNLSFDDNANPEKLIKAFLLMESFELGVSTLAKAYPHHVSLAYRRC